MAAPTADTLGGAELDSLKEQKATPSGLPASRFVQRCHDWVAEWIIANAYSLSVNAIPPSQVIVFIYSESPVLEREKFDALRSQWAEFYARALDQTSQGVIVANENMLVAYQIQPAMGSITDAFELVKAHLRAEDAFVIAQLSQKRLLFHSPGVDIDTWCDDPTDSLLNFAGGPLSAAKIEADIQAFHNSYLKHPSSRVARTIWKGKNFPYQLNPRPEQAIQLALFMLLKGSYPHLRGIVDEEVNDTGGRCDLRVQWMSQPGAVYQPHTATMIELKVLYEAQGTHAHEPWVLSGISQAHGYRTPQTEGAYACIFDARKNQAAMNHLDAVAKANLVELRFYPMQPPAFPKVAKKAGKAGKAATATKAAKSKAVTKQKAAAKVAPNPSKALATKGTQK